MAEWDMEDRSESRQQTRTNGNNSNLNRPQQQKSVLWAQIY